MDPITAIAAIKAAIDLTEALAPQIKAWIASGEISAEQQAELKGRLDALKSNPHLFDGLEWET